MAKTTTIVWSHSTFNPWRGCIEVSEGCTNCYARELVTGRQGLKLWGPAKTTPRLRTSEAYWKQPHRWNREAQAAMAAGTMDMWRVFCGSLCDWAERHPDADRIRPDLFALIRATPYLTWLLCTKRTDELPNVLPPDWGPTGYPNVWLIGSVESAKVLDRVDELRRVPAVVRGISYEPALGPLGAVDLTGIDWMIYGGESGPKFRCDSDSWAREARDRCASYGTAFLFKQTSALRDSTRPTLDGVSYQNYPTPRRVVGHPSFSGDLFGGT